MPALPGLRSPLSESCRRLYPAACWCFCQPTVTRERPQCLNLSSIFRYGLPD